MFNSLTGTVTGKLPQKIFIDTHGIEWDITVPDSSSAAFAQVGQPCRVFTWLQHTDALMNLFGFASDSDRSLFFDLLKVDGIGPKGAIKIMGSICASDLARILESGDLEALQKVPGVGKKTAAKMLLQLKGKLTLSEIDSSSAAKSDSPYADLVSALSEMGYERKSAEKTVSEIVSRMTKDGSFEGKTEAQKEEILFRTAIVELAR